MANPHLRNDTTVTHQDGGQHIASPEIRYARPANQQRWLKVHPAGGGEDFFLCEYTRVMMIGSKDGRTSFKITDNVGGNLGRVASLTDENARAYLLNTPPTGATMATALKVKYGNRSWLYSEPRSERLDQQWAILTIPGVRTVKVTLNSVWDRTFSPIPHGIHRVMAPDNAHDKGMTGFYVAYAKSHNMGEVIADTIWFPIEMENTTGNSTRYVHIGNLSEGCVTVYELNLWNDVYKFLISHRIPDTQGKYVSYLEVK